MKTITVTASKSYNVIVGDNLLTQVGNYISQIEKVAKVAVVSDDHVWSLYGQTVIEGLNNAGFETYSFIFPAGENSKNGDTYLSILNFLAENHILRSDLLVALGGGVVGDISGFAAATYLRGIKFIQIPTTLLAMVDSSVGGKTAIDLKSGKNLAGAFYQPSLVLCDLDTLKSLPVDIFVDGCAEVIKYGILYDEKLYSHLAENGLDFDREHVIAQCIALKRDVVGLDEYDTGLRQKLNLGHTIGHGIEAQSNYTISHGKAVAIGMAIVAKAASVQKICDEQTYSSINSILKKFGLPYKTEFSAKQLYYSALSDKKRAGSSVNLIVPKKIGDCAILPVSINELENFIEAGL